MVLNVEYRLKEGKGMSEPAQASEIIVIDEKLRNSPKEYLQKVVGDALSEKTQLDKKQLELIKCTEL